MASSKALGQKRMVGPAHVTANIDVSRTTIWRWVRDGKFPEPAVNIGNVVRWRIEDIDAFIAGTWTPKGE